MVPGAPFGQPVLMVNVLLAFIGLSIYLGLQHVALELRGLRRVAERRERRERNHLIDSAPKKPDVADVVNTEMH